MIEYKILHLAKSCTKLILINDNHWKHLIVHISKKFWNLGDLSKKKTKKIPLKNDLFKIVLFKNF